MGRRIATTFVMAGAFSSMFVPPLFAAGGAAAPSAERGPDLAPLRVDGNHLTADGHALRLRGLDWGWWHLMGTRYAEADLQNAARWGANVIRLSFSYNDLQTEAGPPAWKEDGFKDLDEVVRWGRRNRVYVILDMHVVPGGQSAAPYCAGGHDLLWTDPRSQDRFVTLWAEIARRYRDRPEVAAYELLNEPASPRRSPGLLRDVDDRVVKAIRAVDPAKVIVVGGDRGSGPADLTAAMKLDDDNILYTFHWYVGAGGNEQWISTERQAEARSGTTGWVKATKVFTAPPAADHMSVILRSTGNAGTAWYDDVEVKDAAGNALQACGFDAGTQGYRPEAFPNTMDFDPSAGHAKPGSLRSHDPAQANNWAGWVSNRLVVQPAARYEVTAWIKLDHATGNTSLGTMFFRTQTQLDPAQFATTIEPAVRFANRFNVPVYVGEFGCDTSNPDLQAPWVAACVALFEKDNLNWTYWNAKETSGPTGMALQAEHPDGSNYPVNGRLLSALTAGWQPNRR